jgi:hypothetical protein
MGCRPIERACLFWEQSGSINCSCSIRNSQSGARTGHWLAPFRRYKLLPITNENKKISPQIAVRRCPAAETLRPFQNFNPKTKVAVASPSDFVFPPSQNVAQIPPPPRLPRKTFELARSVKPRLSLGWELPRPEKFFSPSLAHPSRCPPSMEIAKNSIASGRVRDLPPSKRFRHVGSHLGSTPSVPLPAKKRMLPSHTPEEAAVALCLPVKKRVIAAPRVEVAGATFCLPAKKRAIVPSPPEDAAPACLPAKKRACAAPADAAVPACVPAQECRRRLWSLGPACRLRSASTRQRLGATPPVPFRRADQPTASLAPSPWWIRLLRPPSGLRSAPTRQLVGRTPPVLLRFACRSTSA